MKISILEKKDKDIIESELESAAGAMGLGDLYNFRSNTEQNCTGLSDMIGICANCIYLNYCCGEYGSVHARCNEYDITLTGRERIKKCTKYSQRGQMTLAEAIQMGHVIELNGGKIGF